jgi:predicted metal-dependent hydrolase
LLHLTDDLIDYVLLHELTHTRVKNHSSDFWDELEKVCPDAKEKRRLLKTYSYCLL